MQALCVPLDFPEDLVQLLVAEMLDADIVIVGRLSRADQLVKFRMERAIVAVLGILDQENHEKRHDRRRSVDHELPGIGEAEQGPGARPHNHAGGAYDEREWTARRSRYRICELREYPAH